MVNSILTALLIIFLSLAGGLQFYLWRPVIMALWLILGLTVGLLAIFRRNIPKIEFIAPWGAVAASALYNGVGAVGITRIWVYTLALFFSTIKTNVYPAIWRVGFAWPFLAWLVVENKNITAAWAMVFFVAGLSRLGRLAAVYAGVYLGILVFMDSRGAVMGAIAAFIIMLGLNRKDTLMILASLLLPATALLCLVRTGTTMIRFYYWQIALDGFLSNPLLGIGPGEIMVQHSSESIEHAHNVVATWAAETGALGLAALISAVAVIIKKTNFQRWQVATLAGLLVHSMVDDMLWWPGLLVLSILIIGDTHDERQSIDYPIAKRGYIQPVTAGAG